MIIGVPSSNIKAIKLGSVNGMSLYAIGIKGFEGIVGLMYLTYNMFRKFNYKLFNKGRCVLLDSELTINH